MRKIVIILGICLSLIMSLFLYIKITERNPKFSVIFFNIGQGDAALIKFNNGQKMLVDCGVDRKILAKLGSVLPFYDRTIDFLLITHPDSDHYGGCVDVLDRYDVKEIIINNAKKESDLYWRFFDQKEKQEGAIIKIITEPENWVIGSSTLEFLNPDSSLNLSAKDSGGNNASIVFRLISNNEKFLFAGDMEIPLENALEQKYCSSTLLNCPALEADILKVGHHGSDSSTGEDLLKAVNPKEAIISVGQNTFGHPSFRVLKKLDRNKIKMLRTDEFGDILKQ